MVEPPHALPALLAFLLLTTPHLAEPIVGRASVCGRFTPWIIMVSVTDAAMYRAMRYHSRRT
ncbi:MAG: hypothetical protein K2Y56_01250 [Methylobacterium sp.]|uniref:hypothetical protein n=1 Tax=Methylobacterium sp. TaxID=409 RepID=UPI0025FCCFD8|nr:hypothetical protein [Methylobacterium sp.]MBX9930159.1 hypothetical protein [Methylobacterium sp.]